MNTEQKRLSDHKWRKWGPYLSERQWGTVREDYSEYGNAWDYFSHDHARSRVYRWGEDGIAGICNESKYFDVFTEYAKNDTEDICVRITVHNRAAESAYIAALPTLWLRNL